MESYREGFSWFGIFGFSTVALVNNFDTLFILAFLLVKIVIIKVIFSFLSHTTKDILGIRNRFLPFLFIEVIAIIPFMMISAITSVSSSVETSQGSREKVTQVFLLFLCIILVPIWFVIKTNDLKKLQKSTAKRVKKSKAISSEKKTVILKTENE